MEKIEFIKMQGAGNDYIFIDGRKGEVFRLPEKSRILSRRRFSVGGDGLVYLSGAEDADCAMQMFNSDGSRGEICGTALRCVGRYLADGGTGSFSVKTSVGVREVKVSKHDVSVDMGRAEFVSPYLPEKERLTFSVLDRNFTFYPVSVGNPHAVCFVDDFDFDMCTVAEELNAVGGFSRGANVEFVCAKGNRAVAEVIERGSGRTLSCGSGACAIASAMCKNRICPFGEVQVIYPGGVLSVCVGADFSVSLAGEAEEVYRGVCYL